MKLSELIAELRYDINDIDSVEFEDPIIIAYINNAMMEIFNVRPDIFETNMDVKLSAGGVQNICCCTNLRKVNFFSDGNGTKVAEVKPYDVSASVAFGKKNCVGNNRNYSILSNQSINIEPPIKQNENAWLNITCSNPPEPFTSLDNYANINHQTKAAVKFWVLFELHKTEQESQTSTRLSISYLNNFYQTLGVKRKIKDSYEEYSPVLQNKV